MTAPTMRAMRICTAVRSGDEADAAGLFGAELDVGESRGGDDVGVALAVGEADVGRAASSALEIDFFTAAAGSLVSKLSSRPVFAMPMRIST